MEGLLAAFTYRPQKGFAVQSVPDGSFKEEAQP
jgi:hypothetical protein